MRRNIWSRAVWRSAALLAGVLVAVSCALAYYTVTVNARTVAAASARAAQAAADDMVDTLGRYQYGLRGARSAVALLGEAGLTRAAFRNYTLTRDLQQEFPGARGFGYIRRVAQDREAAFVAAAQADGKPDFAIVQLQAHDGERYVIEYIEPVLHNAAAIGVDIASESARRLAAQAAMRSGEVQLTAPITLVQERGHPAQSFLILMPVYRGYQTPPDPAARAAALIGWTYAPLMAQDVLAAARLGAGAGIITLDDITEGRPGQRFYRTEQAAAPAGPASRAERTVYGRRWQLTFEPLPHFVAALGLIDTHLVLGASLVLSLTCVLAYSLLLANSRGRRRLVDQQVKLAAIVEGSIDGIVSTDLAGIVLSWNRGAQRIFGYTAQEAIGHPMLALIVPHGLAHQERDILARIARGEGIPHFQTVRRCSDGRLIDVSISVAPIRDTAGVIVGASKTVRDISELQSAHRRIHELNAGLEEQVEQRTAELNAARKTLRTVLDAVPSMIGYWDVNLINRVANRSYHDWFGVDPGKVPGMHMRELLGEAIYQANLPYIQAVLRGEPQHFERSIPGPTGGVRHSLANYLPDIVDGQVRGFYVLVHDVTELVTSRQQLARLNLLLENVLRSSSEIAIIATDCDGVITVFNIGAELMLGYRAQDMVGRDPGCLHVAEEVAARGRELSLAAGREVAGFQVFVHVPAQAGVERREWTYVRRDGTRVPVELVVTAMRDDDGRITGYLGMASDVSQRRQFEASLVLARQMAEQASAAKGQFLANMSHEIRTPMNAVLGMLQLVRRSALSPRQRDYIDKAYSASQSLLAILNDILDFSKIDAGKMEIECIAFDLEALLRDLGAVLVGNQVGKPVEVLFALPATLTTWVRGDRLRLQQVLINLAGNALKFTQQGQVVLSLEERSRSPGHVVLRVSVSDTGIGMSAEQLRIVFDGFSQGEASISRRFGGTGLGLAISRRLVALMGGALQVESAPGAGSRFWFDLELGVAPAPSPPAPLEPVHLLVVEDNPVAADILTRMIASLGWSARLAADAGQALALAASERYDAVLMDWRLPDMDGLAAAALLRQAGPAQAPPVIMVTANGQEVLHEAAERDDAPFCDYLTKPFTPAQLRAVALKAVHGGCARGLARTALRLGRRPLAGLRLLAVEDNAVNRQVVYELLSDEGAQVELADSGLQGVNMVLGGGAYDVVVMDMQMPDIDGLEATRRIRADGRFAGLPILAMTANVSAADRALCLAAGMNGHVGKPIDIDAMVAMILSLCGRGAWPESDPNLVPVSVPVPRRAASGRRGRHRSDRQRARPLRRQRPRLRQRAGGIRWRAQAPVRAAEGRCRRRRPRTTVGGAAYPQRPGGDLGRARPGQACCRARG